MHEISNWQPWMVYTWTKKQLQAWYDAHGSWAYYDGKSWCPKARSLGVGRYEVRWVEYDHVEGGPKSASKEP